MCLIEATQIKVCFAEKTILADLNLKIPAGKITAIIGPNGSGKSTLLKALTGLVKVKQGQVLFKNNPLQKISSKKLAQQMAFLPQSPLVPADLTVKDLVAYGRFPHRSWWQNNEVEESEIIEWSLGETEIEYLKDRLVSTLSGGERQRAWIAMALAQKPQLLMLDEPTTYLDIGHQLEVLNIIKKLNIEHKISIVMVVHDLNQALQYADNIVVMAEGKIVASGSPQSVITKDLLKGIFGVEADEIINSLGYKNFLPLKLVKPKNKQD